MPKGENFKGPFSGLPSEGGIIADVKCKPCSSDQLDVKKPLKVNGHGWLTSNCSTCGGREGAASMQSAKSIITRASNWRAGSKKHAYETAGLSEAKPAPEPKPEPTPAPRADPEATPKKEHFADDYI